MATYINKPQNTRKKHTIRYVYDGRQKEKSFVTKREAMDFKAKFEHDSREQIFVDPKQGSEKFRDAAERWVSNLTGADSSKRVYRMVLRNHINPAIGDRSVRHVASDRYALETLLKTTLPEKGLGGSQIKTCYIVIRAVINDLLKAGKLSQSRINGISLPFVPSKVEIIWPTFDQMTQMAEAMPAPYGNLLWLMRGCGLRVGEALAVRWENLKDGTLRVSEQLLPDGTYGPLKHRKPDEYRDVPVPNYVLRALYGYTNQQGGLEERYGYVFPATLRRNVDRWVRNAKTDASLPAEFTSHMLRHIFASVSLSNGVPITDVSAWLGHRDINMTYATYGHLVPSAWGKARHVLDDEYDTWKETGSLD